MEEKKHKKQSYRMVMYNSILVMDHYKYLLEKILSKTIDLTSVDNAQKVERASQSNINYGPDGNVDQLIKVIRTINSAIFEMARINNMEFEEIELKESPPLYI